MLSKIMQCVQIHQQTQDFHLKDGLNELLKYLIIFKIKL